jgi:hypothetical protein
VTSAVPLANVFAKLAQFVNIDFEPPIPHGMHRNIVDCAIGPVDLEDRERDVYWIGEVQGWRLNALRQVIRRRSPWVP